MTQYDKDKLKQDNDLATFIERTENISPYRTGGRRNVYYSPFRDERSPSFMVYHDTQSWKDYGRGGGGGDIFTFIMERGLAGTFPEALAFLAGGVYQPREPRKREPNKPREFKEISMRGIEMCAEWADVAEPYWNSAGVSSETVFDRWLGTQFEYPHRYGFLDGTVINTKCTRYTIPHIRPDEVTRKPKPVAVNTRRLETYADEYLAQYPELVARVRADIAIRKSKADKRSYAPEDIKDAQVKDALFGAKYMYWSKWNPSIFNIHLLVDYKGEGVKELRRRSEVVLVEAEKCALSNCDAGIPTVGFKPNMVPGFKSAFSRVTRVILAYNDDPAGREFAAAAKKELGEKAVAVKMLDGYKDPSEMNTAGVIHKWADRYGINRVDPQTLKPVFAGE